MIILEEWTDTAGFLRKLVRLSNGAIQTLKFQSEPTQDRLDEIEAGIVERMEQDAIPQMTGFFTLENRDILINLVREIKARPNLTLTQYNTWLSAQPWYTAAVVRHFVYVLALELAKKHGVVLADFTEAQVLGKVRDFIVNASAKTLGRIIFGQYNFDL